MFGSFLGKILKQSILQARVLNLTAAGAAVGGFFGFPMAGALFVLEMYVFCRFMGFSLHPPPYFSHIVSIIQCR